MVEVSLTVGKLDASLALLLTKDHHLIEFPTILLPDGVQAGSIVKIRCDRDLNFEKSEQEKFRSVQDEILEKFGKSEPKKPTLRLRNVTQTLCVLEWDPLELSTASLKALTLYKNGERLGQIPNPMVNTTTKLSGLPVDKPYRFSLRLDTTAGTYYSDEISVRTHKMTDLSGITVCLGEIDWSKENYTREDIEAILESIGAKPLQDEVRVDTTHFICTLAKGAQWKKAVDNNIPVVRPEWLKACDQEKRISGVRMFYLDSTGDAISQHKIIRGEKAQKVENEEKLKAEKAKAENEKEFDDVPLENTPDNEKLKETFDQLDKITKAEEKFYGEKNEDVKGDSEPQQKSKAKPEDEAKSEVVSEKPEVSELQAEEPTENASQALEPEKAEEKSTNTEEVPEIKETEESKAEEPKTEEPKTEEPKTEEPKVEEAKVEESAASKHESEEPAPQKPKSDETTEAVSDNIEISEEVEKDESSKKDENNQTTDITDASPEEPENSKDGGEQSKEVSVEVTGENSAEKEKSSSNVGEGKKEDEKKEADKP